MILNDLMSDNECTELAAELFRIYGISSAVYDSTGTIVSGKPHWSNRLCPIIKGNPESLAAICAPSNQSFLKEVEQTGKPRIGECDAGFRKVCVPIIVDGQFLGAAGGCGLLCGNEDIETFFIGKLLKLKEEEIVELYRGTSVMTETEGSQMANFTEKRISDLIQAQKVTAIDD